VKHRAILFLLTIFCVHLSLFSQLGIGNGRLKGKILDNAGNKLVGAEITIKNLVYGGTWTVHSGNNGTWSVTGLASAPYLFVVTMEGYIPARLEMRISFAGQLSQNLDITLNKAVVTKSPGMERKPAQGQETPANLLIGEGNILYDQKQYKEAIVKYQECLAVSSAEYDVYVNIGNCFRELQEYEKAIETYSKYLDIVKADNKSLKGNEVAARIFSTIGKLYLDQQNYDKAKEYFQSAIDTLPNDEIMAYNVGEILFNQGNAEQAIEYLNAAIKIKKDWAQPYLKLGYAYLNKAEYRLALDSLKRFLELAPTDIQAPTVKNLIPQIEELAKKK
jgi:tetratricopeptide (TPR) repeat protein